MQESHTSSVCNYNWKGHSVLYYITVLYICNYTYLAMYPYTVVIILPLCWLELYHHIHT